MKTKIYQIATVTFLSLIILVGNVYADGTGTSALSNENMEDALEIENWMVNDSIWNSDNFMLLEMEAAFFFEVKLALEVEAEDALEIENWMTDDEMMGMETILIMESEAALEVEIEEALEIEDWMTNDENFNMSNIIEIEIEEEQDLELESWMTDVNIWNK